MDWFERLTGFGELGYKATRAKLAVHGDRLHSLVNGRSFGVGRLELPTLGALREAAAAGGRIPGRRTVSIVEGDVRQLHRESTYAGAIFQVASQFNMLEMTRPEITPEHGVTRYMHDPTQGPACAIAAGAATIFRNYFAPVADHVGQTRHVQLDGFADLGQALSLATGRTAPKLWAMRNGYAMFTSAGVEAVSGFLRSASAEAQDELRQTLRVGMHWDVEVTETQAFPGPTVTQAFCSALPVSYNDERATKGADWEPFATLVLEAAYEATLWAAVINGQRGASKVVLLTMLGGGAFGNPEPWILRAMSRAIEQVGEHGLDIVIVSYRRPSGPLKDLVEAMRTAVSAEDPKLATDADLGHAPIED